MTQDGWIIVVRMDNGKLGAFIDPARKGQPYDTEADARRSALGFPAITSKEWDVWQGSTERRE